MKSNETNDTKDSSNEVNNAFKLPKQHHTQVTPPKFLLYYCLASPCIFILVVLVLGFVTPGSNHVSDTISVLSIKKYGFIQQLNFIQLGIFFCISGYLFSQQLTTTSSKKTLKKMLIFCIIFIFLIVVFPTDDFHQVSSLSDMTLHGAIHLLALLIFFLVAPIGVYYLSRVLDKEPVFGKFAKCTAITGYITTCLCYGWTFLFLSGSYLQYLGLFQKIIVLIALGWFLKLMYIMKKNLLLS